MNDIYAVLGAGRQGVAAAYDLIRFGGARSLILADQDEGLAQSGAERLNRLTGTSVARPTRVDVTDESAVAELLRPVGAVVSAVPYALNLAVSRACIASHTHMCDLGGNTGVVWSQMALNPQAEAAGVCIIPDCGLQPGLGNILATYAMEEMTDPSDVRIWVGGLPQKPRPPFDFLLTFNIEGLTNEYDETSVVLWDGARAEMRAFEGWEEIEFPEPVGRCEAFITTGGTSTCPWSFEGRLKTYVEKTVRLPGHLATFRAFRDLGLFGRQPVNVGDVAVKPRDFYHRLLDPLIDFPDDRDVVVLRVTCSGQHEGRRKEVTIDLIDFYDEITGFRAMERATGWPTAIVAGLMTHGLVKPGALPLERAIPARPFVAELRKRQFQLTQTVRESGAL